MALTAVNASDTVKIRMGSEGAAAEAPTTVMQVFAEVRGRKSDWI